MTVGNWCSNLAFPLRKEIKVTNKALGKRMTSKKVWDRMLRQEYASLLMSFEQRYTTVAFICYTCLTHQANSNLTQWHGKYGIYGNSIYTTAMISLNVVIKECIHFMHSSDICVRFMAIRLGFCRSHQFFNVCIKYWNSKLFHLKHN